MHRSTVIPSGLPRGVAMAGTTYATDGSGEPVTPTTPVLDPGCGLLTYGVDCCHVDHYLAIKASKA
jgi:hypothetical protein